MCSMVPCPSMHYEVDWRNYVGSGENVLGVLILIMVWKLVVKLCWCRLHEAVWSILIGRNHCICQTTGTLEDIPVGLISGTLDRCCSMGYGPQICWWWSVLQMKEGTTWTLSCNNPYALSWQFTWWWAGVQPDQMWVMTTLVSPVHEGTCRPETLLKLIKAWSSCQIEYWILNTHQFHCFDCKVGCWRLKAMLKTMILTG